VEAEGRDAEAIQKVVAAEEEEVKVKQVETQTLKDDAQKDLEEVCVNVALNSHDIAV
jgi:hypothetical protein